MVLVLSIASLALAAISAVSGRVVPRKSAPKDWDCENLEPYGQYHSRYLSFDCQSHHGTQYFDLCCHPRQANETSVPFPSQCGCDEDDNGDDNGDNSSSSSYSTQMTPTPTDVAPTPTDSPQPEESPEPSSSTSSTPTPSPTPSPVVDTSSSNNNGGDNSNTSTDNTSTSSTSNTNNSGSGDVHTGGQATFFYQDGVAGACGQVHSDNDLICAMDQEIFGTSGPSSPLCGKQVTITNTANGNTVTVTVADDCPTCSGPNSIDLSVAAFQQLGSLSEGVLGISWVFDS